MNINLTEAISACVRPRLKKVMERSIRLVHLTFLHILQWVPAVIGVLQYIASATGSHYPGKKQQLLACDDDIINS